MDRLKRAVLLTCLMEKMRENGSWCGETHLQKSVFCFQHLFDVPMGYEFVLYKYGPYSFELKDDITGFLADSIFEVESMPAPYGPKLNYTKSAKNLQNSFKRTLNKYREKLDFVAKQLGDKGVAELEKIGTALFVTLQNGKESPVESRAREITKIKPHILNDEAIQAVNEVDLIGSQAQSLVSTA